MRVPCMLPPRSTNTLGVLRQQQKPAYSAVLQQLIANRTCFPPCHFFIYHT
jgi:hypothetical protein